MDIDKRLEALTQSVELLAMMHKDQIAAAQATDKRLDRLATFVTDIAEGTARLLHVVEVHEQRLDDLEGNGLPH